MKATRAPESFIRPFRPSTTTSVTTRYHSLSFSKPCQQFPVDAAKTAVAEHHHHITALNILGDVADNGVRIRQISGRFAAGSDLLHQFLRVEPFSGGELFQPGDLGHHHGIGIRERGGQFVLKNIPARRIRARLENGADLLPRIFDAQRPQGLADGRRMMAKIINYRHAARDALDFHPPLDALEGVEGALNLFIRQAAVFRRGDDTSALRTFNSPTRFR